MPDQKKTRRSGMYFVPNGDGEIPLISVTEVLKVIDKPALMRWYGSQVYFATQKDPSLDEKGALYAPYSVSKGAATRGTSIHDVIEGTKRKEELDLAHQGYVTAYEKWRHDYQPSEETSEHTVIASDYGYAGTLDRIVTINGEKILIDFKTNKKGEIYPEAHIQASAYIHAVNELSRGLIVGLAEDGTYHVQEVRYQFPVFVACLRLYVFLHEEKLKSLGWECPPKLSQLFAE